MLVDVQALILSVSSHGMWTFQCIDMIIVTNIVSLTECKGQVSELLSTLDGWCLSLFKNTSHSVFFTAPIRVINNRLAFIISEGIIFFCEVWSSRKD